MMAMAVLRKAERLVGFDLSATMFWDHPTVSSLAAHLAEMLRPLHVSIIGGEQDLAEAIDSEGSLLDELFSSVESATAGSESGI
jgi:hypothetical protein